MAKLRKNGTTTRTERRREAESRQEYYNSLTPQQKLDKLPPTGSKNKKMKDIKPSRKERWEEKQKEN